MIEGGTRRFSTYSIKPVLFGPFTMDELFFREKAAVCLRLAQGLSPNNPGHFQLLELAKDFHWRARELEEQSIHSL
jgi:hypothetical protein